MISRLEHVLHIPLAETITWIYTDQRARIYLIIPMYCFDAFSITIKYLCCVYFDLLLPEPLQILTPRASGTCVSSLLKYPIKMCTKLNEKI